MTRSRTLLQLRTTLKCSASFHRGYSQSRSMSLSFDLHDAYGNEHDAADAPVIFLHGLFGSKRNNRSISKALARVIKRPIYTLDLRNHGDSPHSIRHDYLAMAEDVEEFIRKHQLKETTLIGHSMGAKTAMCIALRSQRQIANIIVVDNAPVDAALKSDFGKYIQGMKKVERSEVTRHSDADEILRQFEEALPIRQFLLTNLHRPSQSQYLRFRLPLDILAASLDNMADFPFKDPSHVRYDGPALFIRGTKSHYVPDDFLPIIGRFFPRFELKDIDSGHWVISENPEAFKTAVVEFLLYRE